MVVYITVNIAECTEGTAVRYNNVPNVFTTVTSTYAVISYDPYTVFCTSLVVHCTVSALTWQFVLLHVSASFKASIKPQCCARQLVDKREVSPFVSL